MHELPSGSSEHLYLFTIVNLLLSLHSTDYSDTVARMLYGVVVLLMTSVCDTLTGHCVQEDAVG